MRRHHQAVVGTLLAVVCLWGLIQPAGAAVQYTVTGLSGVGGDAYKINQSGQVAGYTTTAGGSRRGYVWTDGSLTTLGTLVGDSFAEGLNDRGQVVGQAYASAGYTDPRAVLWENGTIRELSPSGGPKLWTAWDVNSAEQVAVETQTSAYIWQDGVLRDLGIRHAYAINDVGQVAGTRNTGQSDANGPIAHAVLWTNGTVRDLGTLGGHNSKALDINDNGVVIGWSDTATSPYLGAFWWDDAGMHALPAGGIQSAAYGINGLGEIVGVVWLADNTTRGFVFNRGVVTDLNDLVPSGWSMRAARAINDRGQIVATGSFQGAPEQLVVLSPIPWPSSILLLLVGFLKPRRRVLS